MCSKKSFDPPSIYVDTTLTQLNDVFLNIFSQNLWRGTESVSGLGSSLNQTRIIRDELPDLLKQFSIESLLDIPCGDFNWMKEVDLGSVRYLGVDVVPDLISKNSKYKTDKIEFRLCDILQDKLPYVDLVFARDLFVHFSDFHVFRCLQTICNSGATYLLTTSYPEKENSRIISGQWRPLNFEKTPFNFPKPLAEIREGCTESTMIFSDKSLCLWSIDQIKETLRKFENVELSTSCIEVGGLLPWKMETQERTVSSILQLETLLCKATELLEKYNVSYETLEWLTLYVSESANSDMIFSVFTTHWPNYKIIPTIQIAGPIYNSNTQKMCTHDILLSKNLHFMMDFIFQNL